LGKENLYENGIVRNITPLILLINVLKVKSLPWKKDRELETHLTFSIAEWAKTNK